MISALKLCCNMTLLSSLFLLALLQLLLTEGAKCVGVCFGRVADNLPPAPEVVDLFKSNGIRGMRIYDPDQETLEALRGSDIAMILGVQNSNIEALVDPTMAQNWVQNNVANFSPDVNFRYISVGNEIKPQDSIAEFVLQAMNNINAALIMANLGQIMVSTTVDGTLLEQSYPPSAGQFSAQTLPYITPILTFLEATGSSLLANVYPYFSYIGDPQHITLDYALFTSPGIVVPDEPYGYQNLFDATLDGYYAALEKVGFGNVTMVVAESGWPSAGEPSATLENAQTYYTNLVKHVDAGGCTPRRAEKPIEAYLFAMFDEDQKGPAESEKHFGLFTPDKQPKYGNIFGS